MLNRNRQSEKAFTLLELLVAMTIMAVITASLYSTLRLAFRIRDTVQQAVAPLARVNAIFDLIRTDLFCSVAPTMELAGVFTGEQATRNNNDVLNFYSSNYSSQTIESACDIYQVEYALEQYDPWQGYALVKHSSTNILSSSDVLAKEEILCRGVYSFKLEYYDGLAWVTSWDSETTESPLPLLVKITIELAKNISTDNDGKVPETVALTGQFLVPQPPEVQMQVQEQLNVN